MEDCEICGRPAQTRYIVEIEGAEMTVCVRCAKGKKVMEKIEEMKEEKPKYVSRMQAAGETEIIDNYGTALRKAREALGLPLKVIAEKISEKESTLRRVEEEKMLPGEDLLKKLEKELGVKLTAKGEAQDKQVRFGDTSPITIGDAAIRKENKE